jgi:hypothetical protein
LPLAYSLRRSGTQRARCAARPIGKTAWMQTIGATLAAVRTKGAAQCVCGCLLMAAAARIRCCTSLLNGTTGASINPAGCEAPTRFQVCAAGAGAGHGVRGLDCLPTESGFWEWSSSVSARQAAMHELP